MFNSIFFIFIPVEGFVHEQNGSNSGQHSEHTVQSHDQEVDTIDGALVLVEDALFNRSLLRIVDVFRPDLLPLDRFLDLVLLLVDAPDVLDGGLLPLPRLDVEG